MHRFTTRFNFHVFDSVAASFNDKDDPRQQNDAESITAEKIIKSSSLGDLTALKRIRPTYEDLIQASKHFIQDLLNTFFFFNYG